MRRARIMLAARTLTVDQVAALADELALPAAMSATAADASTKIAQLQERIKELNQKLMAASPAKR